MMFLASGVLCWSEEENVEMLSRWVLGINRDIYYGIGIEGKVVPGELLISFG